MFKTILLITNRLEIGQGNKGQGRNPRKMTKVLYQTLTKDLKVKEPCKDHSTNQISRTTDHILATRSNNKSAIKKEECVLFKLIPLNP